MNFTIFRYFLEFFYIYFRVLKSFKLIKKSQKGIYFARLQVDATWHSGPRGSATWTACRRLRGTDVTCDVFIFTIYIYIMYIGLPIIERQDY